MGKKRRERVDQRRADRKEVRLARIQGRTDRTQLRQETKQTAYEHGIDTGVLGFWGAQAHRCLVPDASCVHLSWLRVNIGFLCEGRVVGRWFSPGNVTADCSRRAGDRGCRSTPQGWVNLVDLMCTVRYCVQWRVVHVERSWGNTKVLRMLTVLSHDAERMMLSMAKTEFTVRV